MVSFQRLIFSFLALTTALVSSAPQLETRDTVDLTPQFNETTDESGTTWKIDGDRISNIQSIRNDDSGVLYSGSLIDSEYGPSVTYPVVVKVCTGRAKVASCLKEYQAMYALQVTLEGHMPPLVLQEKEGTTTFRWVADKAAGGDLTAYIESGYAVMLWKQFRQKVVWEVFQLCWMMHEAGWSHGNITTDNIMFGNKSVTQPPGPVWFVDFAAATNTTDKAKTMFSGATISADYVPPERAKSRKLWGAAAVINGTQDPKAGDIWTAGVSMFKFLYGMDTPLFTDTNFLKGVETKRRSMLQNAIRQSSENVNADWVNLWMGIFNPDPAQRFDAKQVVGTLQGLNAQML
ncbi:Uu.00g144890.m01.CDS01 [Anthostomella pinea]|uniref:Uu.00g144890.m01.CDS01 n=1 Tax=Anthostomella pinea TaxID=933095 RepID=A0AAI8VRU7_9PEZI|nr:Uu.00g144890.m01.CDS01 [Anthostomella pinea]